MEERPAGLTGIHIVDYDCVTCFGAGHEVLWKSLLENQSGSKTIERFSTENYVNDQAACISELDEVPHGERFFALLEMLCQREMNLSSETILLTATTKDNIELHERAIKELEGGGFHIPSYSIVDFLSQRWNLRSPGQNINTACTSASTAILWASEMISRKQTDTVIVCGADLVSEFVFSGFSALKAMSASTSRPFDRERDGLMLGETAAYLVLMSQEKAREQKRKTLGVINGWGISSDAHHITAPDRQGQGLQRAIGHALEKASISAGDLSSINAHGTGTVHNDAMEITAFSQIFDDKIPSVYSIKGAIGHSLGPCGLVEAIVAARSLQEQIIPPVTGLQTPEAEVASCVSNEPETVHGDYALSVNSGFGGINTALVLGKA